MDNYNNDYNQNNNQNYDNNQDYNQNYNQSYDNNQDYNQNYNQNMPVYVQPQISQEEMNMAGLIPLLNIFGLFIVSLILWVVKKDEMPFVNASGKEFLNFIISMAIYSTVAGVLTIALIGFVLLPVVGIYALVINIIGTVKAFKGELYIYPLCIRILK